MHLRIFLRKYLTYFCLRAYLQFGLPNFTAATVSRTPKLTWLGPRKPYWQKTVSAPKVIDKSCRTSQINFFHTDSCEDQSFHFIPVRKSDQVQERKDQRLARSHAVKQALQAKRRLQRESSTNFCAVCPLKQVQSSRADLVKCLSVSPANRIGFEKLAVDSKRLEFLLCQGKTSLGRFRRLYTNLFAWYRCRKTRCGAGL